MRLESIELSSSKRFPLHPLNLKNEEKTIQQKMLDATPRQLIPKPLLATAASDQDVAAHQWQEADFELPRDVHLPREHPRHPSMLAIRLSLVSGTWLHS